TKASLRHPPAPQTPSTSSVYRDAAQACNRTPSSPILTFSYCSWRNLGLRSCFHMSLVALITFMTGLVLGTRFRYLILVPATVFAVAAIVGVGLLHADDAGSMVIAMLIAAICL